MLERSTALASALDGHVTHGLAQHLQCVLRILIQRRDDLRRGHRLVLRVPAVVIRNHGDGGITKLRLARQLRFRNIGHPDHFKPQLPVQMRLGERGKLRPFDADVSAARMRFYATLCASTGKHRRHLRARRLVECHVSDQPAAEKRRHAAPRAVHKLVGHQKFSRPQILLQRAHCTHGNNPFDPKLLHRANIRAKIDLARQNAMPSPMPCQKRHPLPFQRANHNRIRRFPERRLHVNLAGVLQPGHRVKPAAADDADCRRRFFATLSCPRRRHSPPPKPVSLISPPRKIRCASKCRSPRKMDLFFSPPLLPPIASTAPPRPLLPAPAATTATPAVRSIAASNALRACACAPRSLRNACETAQSYPQAHRFPCSPLPLCAPPEDASHRAASPATTWRSTAAPIGLHPRDRICSTQKCRRSPSARPSCFECRRPFRAPASPPRNRPAARCRFRLARRRPFRSTLVACPRHQEAAPPPPSPALALPEIPA